VSFSVAGWPRLAWTARNLTIPSCGNDFLHFSYMQASQANLEALYRICFGVEASGQMKLLGGRGASASLTLEPFHHLQYLIHPI